MRVVIRRRIARDRSSSRVLGRPKVAWNCAARSDMVRGGAKLQAHSACREQIGFRLWRERTRGLVACLNPCGEVERRPTAHGVRLQLGRLTSTARHGRAYITRAYVRTTPKPTRGAYITGVMYAAGGLTNRRKWRRKRPTSREEPSWGVEHGASAPNPLPCFYLPCRSGGAELESGRYG